MGRILELEQPVQIGYHLQASKIDSSDTLRVALSIYNRHDVRRLITESDYKRGGKRSARLGEVLLQAEESIDSHRNCRHLVTLEKKLIHELPSGRRVAHGLRQHNWVIDPSLGVNAEVRESVVEDGFDCVYLCDDISVERRFELEPDSFKVGNIIAHKDFYILQISPEIEIHISEAISNTKPYYSSFNVIIAMNG